MLTKIQKADSFTALTFNRSILDYDNLLNDLISLECASL